MIADLSEGFELAVRRSAQDSFGPVFQQALWHASIRYTGTLPDHTSKGVAAAGFDHHMAVLRSREAGSKTDEQAGGMPQRLRRALGHAGIHDHSRMQSLGCAG